MTVKCFNYTNGALHMQQQTDNRPQHDQKHKIDKKQVLELLKQHNSLCNKCHAPKGKNVYLIESIDDKINLTTIHSTSHPQTEQTNESIKVQNKKIQSVAITQQKILPKVEVEHAQQKTEVKNHDLAEEKQHMPTVVSEEHKQETTENKISETNTQQQDTIQEKQQIQQSPTQQTTTTETIEPITPTVKTDATIKDDTSQIMQNTQTSQTPVEEKSDTAQTQIKQKSVTTPPQNNDNKLVLDAHMFKKPLTQAQRTIELKLLNPMNYSSFLRTNLSIIKASNVWKLYAKPTSERILIKNIKEKYTALTRKKFI